MSAGLHAMEVVNQITVNQLVSFIGKARGGFLFLFFYE